MGQNNNFQGPEINCWVAQGSLPSVFFFLNETKQKHLLYLTSTLLALIDLISVIKDVFCASVYTGFAYPTPTSVDFPRVTEFSVPFGSDASRFCVSVESKIICF